MSCQRHFVVCGALCLSVAACQPSAPPPASSEDTSAVIAEVDGRRLTMDELEEELQRLPEAVRENETELRKRIAQELVRRKALAAAAEQRGIANDPAVQRAIERARDRILVDALAHRLAKAIPSPSEAELRKWYEAHKARFHQPEKAHGRWIVVDTRAKAERLLRILRRYPKRFSQLAAEHSLDDATKGIGGDLNWTVRGVLPKPLEEVLFSLKPGEIAGPVRVPQGWAIVQLLEKQKASTLSFEQARELVLAAWQKEALHTQLESIAGSIPVRWRIEEYRFQK